MTAPNSTRYTRMHARKIMRTTHDLSVVRQIDLITIDATRKVDGAEDSGNHGVAMHNIFMAA